MPLKLAFCCFLFAAFSIVDAFAKNGPGSPDVADFAPLDIGNVWKYKGDYLSGWMVMQYYSDSSLRIVRVDSVAKRGDSTLYLLSFVDSLYDRKDLQYGTRLPDSVFTTKVFLFERSDGTLVSGGYASPQPTFQGYRLEYISPIDYFYKHTVPDSMIVGEYDSGQKAHRLMRTWNSVYAENIGLMVCRNYNGHNNYWWTSHELIEFNGVAIRNAGSVSLSEPPRQNPGRRKGPEHGLKGFYYSLDLRNILGRKPH